MKPIKNTVVHLPTKEEYDEYMRMCESEGWVWSNGKKPKQYDVWDLLEDRICIDVKDKFSFCSFSYSAYNGYKIITLKELKDMEKKTLKTLEVGDLITDGVGFRKILAVLHRCNDDTGVSLYSLSEWSQNKKSDAFKRHAYSETSYELVEDGYKIVEDNPDEPEELTMEEVCKELGRVIKIKK